MTPADLNATQLGAAYRDRSLSPVEATQAILDRITRLGVLNAYCHVDADGALAAARASEARHLRGEALGPLDGVPVGIKDLFHVRGMPTREGSLTTDDTPATDDTPSVARLREAGCVLLGKTTTPEFGYKAVTDSPLTGITRNPWNLERTPGGSSGGAAAQVAAGLGPIGIGTDAGGSIRIPASFCGVFGFKPSHGRVPMWPPTVNDSMAHNGPITRCVADAALTMSVIARWDARDWTALPMQDLPWHNVRYGSLAGKRIAFSPDLGFATVDPEVAALVRQAVDLMERLGADVEEVDPGIGRQEMVMSVIWRDAGARLVLPLSETQRALLDPALRSAGESAAGITLAEWHAAQDGRRELAARMRRFHETYDLLVTPTMACTAFPAGQRTPLKPDGSANTGWTPFCNKFNLTQQPAASLPCGLTSEGLPVGVQIVGAMHDDIGVLSACHALEAALGPMPAPALD